MQHQSEEILNISFEREGFSNIPRNIIPTLKSILMTPRNFFSQMHINKGFIFPSVFYIIISLFNICVTSLAIRFGIADNPFNAIAAQFKETVTDQEIYENLISMIKPFITQSPSDFPVIGYIFKAFFINIVVFALFVSVWHLLLSVSKVSRNGFQASFRILAYSSAPLILGVLPFPFINLVILSWIFIIVGRGIEEAHEVFPNQAFLGTLMLPITALILVLISGFVF
ncbi:MAG: YIP1 family protein [Candidatus Delongbacteria bacterium]|nr:YIP1 family protein [Candidatus Delongbacteria bacterium]